ncbi:Abhydro lipase domain containing protein, partial [Asbolus verrucosus]
KFEDYRTIQQNPNCWYNPDVGASPGKIAKRYGYPFESYKITTEDGYVVSLFRIPHNGSEINKKRPSIFLQHGLAADASTWMVLGLKSIVFIYANNGYDVWISNSRGTKYSAKHLKYTVYDPEYWNFRTGQKITYIGHSMGTTMSYVYASLKPEHANIHLKSIVSLAPVAYMDHITPLAKAIVPFRYLIWQCVQTFGGWQQVTTKKKQIKFNNWFMTFQEAFPVITSNFPSGFSLKTLLHYAQIINTTHRFQFFDYGPDLNLKLYNSSVPPEYPLSNIKLPVHLFYGKRDPVSHEKVKHNN